MDAVKAVGVPALGFLWQHPPHDRQAHAVEDYGDDQDVDVEFSEFPVGAIHGQHPAVRRHGREDENQRPDGARRQHAIGKEPLEPPLKRLRFGRGCRVTGEPDQRDGALAENRKDQHQKAGHACLGELQMRFEEFAESLHRRFVGLGMVVFFVRKQWLTPQAAIC